MPFKNIILLLSCLVMMSSCVTKPNHPSGVKLSSDKLSGVKLSPAKYEHTLELLNFIQLYANLEPDAQKVVFLEVKQALAENENHLANRIKLAAMRSLPNNHLRDSVAAQHQLQALLAENNLNISDSNLVNLLYTFTLNNNNKLQKTREETKKNEALKRTNKALKQKLKDLKNIEKTMTERNIKTDNQNTENKP